MLLKKHKFCDIDYSNFQVERIPDLGNSNSESIESEDLDKKSSISMLEIQR